MNIGIITIGDEILIGQVVNRNASWIAERCTESGASVTVQTVVGDELDALCNEIERVSRLVDVIITTGGLGPTHDDITKDALVRITNSEMVVDRGWLQHLENFMKERGRELTDRNAAQARVPASAMVLFNPLGTAPALHLQIPSTYHSTTLRHTAQHLFALPGVPLEMQAVMHRHVLPFIAELLEAVETTAREYRTLHTAGIPESALADVIGDLQFLGTATLAFLPNYQGVRLRIGALGKTREERHRELERIALILFERAGRFIVGQGTTSLPEIVARELLKVSHTVAVAESCTGGLLGSSLTDVPGSSSWFLGGVISYSNEAKVRFLDVTDNTLDSFGAVSEQVAREMSEGARMKFQSTWGIGITGVAGPDGGTEEKPVGTVWIGVSGPDGTDAQRFHFGSDRRMNRERSVGAALTMLLKRLKQ